MSDPIDPPAPDDPELDDRVRAAAGALLGLAPAGQIDGIEAWVLRELTQIDRRGTGAPAPASQSRTENRMMSDREKTPNRVPDVPALKRDGADGKRESPEGGGRTEDSGLHDIKALAQDTKKRISRRITSQHDAYDESLLSSSHSGLRAVALPEPALVVSLPDVPTSMAEVRAAAAGAATFGSPTAATAREGAPVAPIGGRKRTNLWIGLGAAGLAAAAAVVIALGAGGDSKPKQADAIASAETAGTERAPGAAAGSAVATPPSAPSAAMTAGSGSGSAAGSAAVVGLAQPPSDDAPGATGRAPRELDGAAVAPDKKVPAADKGEAAKPRASGSGSGSGSGSSSSSADPKPPEGKAGTAGKVDAAKPPGKGSGAAKPPAGTANSGEKSIEDLLNDASGGPAKPKDVPTGGGGDTGPAKPEKTGLDTKDIKGGMGAVAGKAQGCFDQHGVAGHVKVRVTIASSGSVTKADATGEFAGTPTGACVASAVKGASFPAWTGSSMTVNYAFTLQE